MLSSMGRVRGVQKDDLEGFIGMIERNVREYSISELRGRKGGKRVVSSVSNSVERTD